MMFAMIVQMANIIENPMNQRTPKFLLLYSFYYALHATIAVDNAAIPIGYATHPLIMPIMDSIMQTTAMMPMVMRGLWLRLYAIMPMTIAKNAASKNHAVL